MQARNASKPRKASKSASMSKSEDLTIADLVPDDKNANTGTERGASALEHSLRHYGAGRSVLVDKNNRIIAGNKTIETAASIGMENAVLVETTGDRVVVVRRADIDLDSPEGRGLAIADNRAGELNLAWNQEVLAELGAEIDLTPYFFEDELELPHEEGPVEGLTDDDDVPEVGESPVSERGDVWILGNHRVMCGDSTDAGDVALLMDGKKADLCFTSPPYNLGKSVALRNGQRSGASTAYSSFSDSDVSEWSRIMAEFMKNALQFAHVQAVNVQMLSGNKVDLIKWANDYSNHLVDCLVWVKSNPPPAMAPKVCTSAFEFIFVFDSSDLPSRTIRTANFERGRFSNVFECATASGHDSAIHGAVFSVKFANHYIENLCPSDGSLLDLFLGSGSTLIAAEKTNRKCYGMEISPAYVDVIIKRWQDFTGKQAVHESGRTYQEMSDVRS